MYFIKDIIYVYVIYIHMLYTREQGYLGALSHFLGKWLLGDVRQCKKKDAARMCSRVGREQAVPSLEKHPYTMKAHLRIISRFVH